MRVWLAGLSCLIAMSAIADAAPVKTKPAKTKPAKTALAKSTKSAAARKPLKTATKIPAPPEAPAGAAPSRDLVYATLPGFRPLTLDLYQPPRAPKDFPKPLLVFVHGGSWNSGDSRRGGGFNDFPGMLASLAAKGYVVASVNYRLSGEARFPAAVQDVKTALRWLRAHASNYDIDSTRVAVWGEEAGGQIASLVGTSCGVSALEPPGSPADNLPSDCAQAVIDWHGVSDLASLAEGDAGLPAAGPTPEGAYLGCEPAQCAPGVTRAASPIAYVGPNSPPFLIQHGSHKVIPLAQSQKLADALSQAHVPVDYVTYADGDPDVAKKSVARMEDFLTKIFPDKALNKKPPRITSKALPY